MNLPPSNRHLAALALHRELGRMSRNGIDPLSAERMGLSMEAATALHWTQWLFFEDSSPIHLGIDYRVPARRWPRSLRSPWRGEPVPVTCVASEGGAHAQGWIRVASDALELGQGTLGAILKVRTLEDQLCALTAGHVLGADLGAAPGDAGRLATSTGDTELTGRLRSWLPDFGAPGSGVNIDAALMTVDPSQLNELADDIAWPTGHADATPGAPLTLLTRQHRFDARVLGRTNTRMSVGENGQLSYLFVDALNYQVDGGSEPGDSGAAIWDVQDRLVAIHTGSATAGTAGNAIATPIRRVLSWCGADLVTRGQSLQAAAQPLALPELPAGDAPIAPSAENIHAIDTLARTLWGEARGEPDPDAGMRAVAHVVLNRRDAQTWWGRSVEAVCRKPFQFSCWNENDPNFRKLLAVTQGDARFSMACGIASELVRLPSADRARADTTGGATHYHARNMPRLPNWARGRPSCASIGNHIFYRDIR